MVILNRSPKIKTLKPVHSLFCSYVLIFFGWSSFIAFHFKASPSSPGLAELRVARIIKSPVYTSQRKIQASNTKVSEPCLPWLESTRTPKNRRTTCHNPMPCRVSLSAVNLSSSKPAWLKLQLLGIDLLRNL